MLCAMVEVADSLVTDMFQAKTCYRKIFAVWVKQALSSSSHTLYKGIFESLLCGHGLFLCIHTSRQVFCWPLYMSPNLRCKYLRDNNPPPPPPSISQWTVGVRIEYSKLSLNCSISEFLSLGLIFRIFCNVVVTFVLSLLYFFRVNTYL